MSIEDELNSLRGRVQALELVATALMTSYVAENFPQPATDVEQIEREMLGSLQLMERTTDPDSDAAWAEVATTLRRLFFNVRQRLQAGGDGRA